MEEREFRYMRRYFELYKALRGSEQDFSWLWREIDKLCEERLSVNILVSKLSPRVEEKLDEEVLAALARETGLLEQSLRKVVARELILAMLTILEMTGRLKFKYSWK
jgi:hypothetical protein|uniref:Uncharacterized protein n=1 Tax=Thermofilum pendens TaxID=2269 RepID=A0A7C3SKI8_THEPE